MFIWERLLKDLLFVDWNLRGVAPSLPALLCPATVRSHMAVKGQTRRERELPSGSS